MSDYRRLLVLCVEALSSYDPQQMGEDTHLDDFLTQHTVFILYSQCSNVFVLLLASFSEGLSCILSYDNRIWHFSISAFTLFYVSGVYGF